MSFRGEQSEHLLNDGFPCLLLSTVNVCEADSLLTVEVNLENRKSLIRLHTLSHDELLNLPPLFKFEGCDTQSLGGLKTYVERSF